MTVSPTSAKPDRQLYLVFFVVLALFISLAFLWLYRLEIREIKHDSYETIASIGEGKVEQIRQWRWGRIMDVARDSRSPQLIEGLEKLSKDLGSSSAREQVRDILGIIRRGGEYFRTAAFSPAGKMILQTGDGLFTVDSNALEAARTRPDGVLSDFFRDEQGEVCLDAVAAVRDRGGNHLGFVVLRVRVADRLDPLIRNGPTLKRTMEFFLARREDNQAVFLNDLLHGPASALSLRVPLERTEMNVVRAVSGGRGEFTGWDYRGREVLSDLRPIPDSTWVAVTQMDMGEIMEEVLSRSVYTIAFTVVLILLVASSSAWAYRSRQVGQTRQLLNAERRQKQSADQFRLLLESMHEGFALHEIICDATGTPVDYRFLWVNAAFERMTGKKMKDLVGRNVLEVFPETEKIWIERYGNVAQRGEPIHFEEYSGVFEKHFQVTAFCPQLGQFVVVFEDITDRKASEARIARLTQLYLAHGQCNHAIVHAANAGELLPEICRIAVDLGGLKMAWVGMVDEKDGMIKPVASFGSGSEYLRDIEISTDPESPLGRGPSGTAIRENRPVWCEDFLNDSTTALWHERVRKFGLKISASFPLKIMEKVVGVLNIYGGEADVLDAEGRKLLLEMAGDISYALGYFAREEAMRESESRFRMLVEKLPLGLIYQIPGQPFTYRNRLFSKIFGYTEEEIPTEKEWWPLAYPDPEYRREIREKWEANVRRAMEENREITPLECRVTCKGGEVRTVEIGGLLLDGNLMATFNDITERKRTEDALNESEIRYRTTFEQAAIGVAHIGLDGRWLRVNRKVCDMVGYSMEELLQKTFQEITHPGDLEMEHLLMRKFISGETTTARTVKRYIRKDGSIVPVCLTISTVPGKSGKPAYFIVIIEDISGRMKTEAQLRLRSAALEASANAMVITNDKGEIEWTNPAFTRFTGYTAEEALGKTPALLKSGSHEPAFYKNLWNTIQSGEVWSGEIVNRRKDGTLYTEEMTVTPIRGEGGKASHFIAVKQDISERKLMEEKMLRTQRMESLGTLAAGVAHDLNNILTPILLSADLLRKTNDPAMRESMLGNIEKSVKRGAGIISQVLTFARGTSGRRVILDVKRLVTEIEKITCETFPPGITVTSFIPSGIGEVSGDPTQLHQVLLNLCINARDAMPGGGILFISAERIRVDDNFAAMVPDAKAGDFVMISVVDSGEGIPKNIMGKIFDPFFTTKEIGRGTGLGLSTVAGIIRSHGGFVVVESEVGRGSVFKVYLPASGDVGANKEHTEHPELPMGNGETILLVEDEANILAVTSTVLANGGYKVLKAAGGAEALDIYRMSGGEISLVLTDIMMPKMGGVELARALRQINPRAKIVASTGQATEACEAELRSIGVRVILHKPYDAGKLLAVVHEEIHKKP